jgi:hypothetical protein
MDAGGTAMAGNKQYLLIQRAVWIGLSFSKKIIVSYLITIGLTIFAASSAAAFYLLQLIINVKEMDQTSERSVLVAEIEYGIQSLPIISPAVRKRGEVYGLELQSLSSRKTVNRQEMKTC